MQKQILTELQEIRSVLSVLVGSADLMPEEKFSKNILNKAAKEFKKLSSARKAWVEEYQLNTIFKDLRYGSGKFLREERDFTQYFVQARSHYYNRKALLALARELKERKVNLARYIEYKTDKAKFDAKTKTAAGKKKLATYILPEDMRSIETSTTPAPDKRLVTDELKRLQQEFEEFKDYIDAYDSFAMLKFDYHFTKFRDATYRARCKKWIEQYNYANRALELLNKKP